MPIKTQRITYLVFCFALSCMISFEVNGQTDRPNGINLAGVTDFSTEFPFTNIFKMCREWITHNSDGSGPWDTHQMIPMNENGYPLQVPFSPAGSPPQKVRTLLLWDIEGHYPSGDYRLIVEGTGSVSLSLAANGTWDTPCNVLVPITASDAGVILTIEASDEADPIRNIQLILPDYTETYEEQMFTTEFMDFVSDFDNIRFMDWSETNFSPVRTWSDRTSLDFYSQALHSGVAWEYAIALANLSGKDPWINIPHQADDNYINQLAILFRDQLDPSLRLYIEYSNEVWNGIFTQSEYAATQGAALGYSGGDFERAYKYTVRRSADIFHIFEEVFGSTDRLYNVLPSWIATDGWYSNEMVSLFNQTLYNPHGVRAHGLAVAPYFGGEVADQIADSGEVGSISIDEIIERMDNSMNWVFNQIQINKGICDDNDLELIAYEGGQHLVANWPHVQNDALTEKLIEANRHPGMYDLYCKYTEYWYETVGAGLFSFFSSHYLPNRWGSWGIKEHMKDHDNPKYRAIRDCVFAEGSTSTQYRESFEALKVAPNPTNDILNIQNLPNGMAWKIYNTSGQVCMSGFDTAINVSQLLPGVYFIHCGTTSVKFVKE